MLALCPCAGAIACAFCSSLRRPHWQGPGSGKPIADGSSLPQSAQATSGNLWRQKIGIKSPSSDQMKRSWLGPDRLGDSFVVRRLVSRLVSLAGSEMIGTYLRSASTTDERYDVPRPTSARGWVASWRRGSSATRSQQPADRSLLESPRVFGDVHTVQVQVHMYTRIPGHEPPITPGRSVGRSVDRVTVFMHVCMYCTYTTLRSTWTAETSIIDGRRLTADS